MLGVNSGIVARATASSSLISSSSSSLVAASRWKSGSSKVNLPHDQPYLQKSIIPTYHFQKSLPRLPIPDVDSSIVRYLNAVAPLLTPEEFSHTQKIAKGFQEKEAPKLQKILVERDVKNKHTSFISDMWFDMYLKGRYPVPINSNPFLMMRDDPNPKANEQTTRAANLIVSSLRFKKSLDEEKLFPEVYFMKGDFTKEYERFISFVPRSVSYYFAYAKSAYPLDMVQYKRLFGTARIPKENRDELITNSNSKHIAVVSGGRFYSVDVLNSNGTAKSAAEIASALKAIVEDTKAQGKKASDQESLGLFTTEDRDVWAKHRATLISDPQNKASLDKIDSALFVVCLDSESPSSQIESNKLFLHGDARNRWFDKSFSLYVAANGKAAINFEHSWGDGVAVLRYVNEIYDDSLRSPKFDSVNANPNAIDKLKWNLQDEVKVGLQNAAKKIDATIASLDFATQIYDGCGKKFFKEKKISPDGATQMAFQLAYKKLYGKTVATYESASTAGFLHGRTETIRPASRSSVAFTEAFLNPNTTTDTRESTLRAAVDVHSQLVKEAVTGKGMDRHLFALFNLAKEQGTVPELFKDKAYSAINHNILSTSTLSSKAIEGGGFGPVVADGFGLGYAVEDDFVGFNVTSFGRNTSEFVNHVAFALADIKAVLSGKKL